MVCAISAIFDILFSSFLGLACGKYPEVPRQSGGYVTDGIQELDLLVHVAACVCVTAVHHGFTSLSKGCVLLPSPSTGDELPI